MCVYLAPGDAAIDLLIVGYLVPAVLLVLVAPLQQFLDLLLPLHVAAVQVVKTALDEQFVEVHLEARLLQNRLLDRRVRDETKHNHLLLLADPVRPVLRLQVHLRIPVRVEENDRVRSLQIESQSSRARAEQENIVL